MFFVVRSSVGGSSDVKYMMYQTVEPEQEKWKKKRGGEKKKKGKRRRREGLKPPTVDEMVKGPGGGRFKTLDETASDSAERIITTPFVFCPRDKSLVDNVSMKKSHFLSFSLSLSLSLPDSREFPS